MGYSMVYVADLTVPPGSMATYLAARADARAFGDWPADLAGDFDPEPDSVGGVLDDLARDPGAEITRGDDAIRVRAIVASDGDAWLTLRAPLAAAIRVAAAHGGRGELAIVGYEDGDVETAIRITVADATSKVERLRGGAREALRARALPAIEAIEDRLAEAHTSDALTLLPPAVVAVHARVSARLEAVPDARLRELAARSTHCFLRRGGRGPFQPLAAHFQVDAELRAALTRGWPRMTRHDNWTLPVVGLELAAAIDPAAARAFARQYLDAGALATLRDEAAALALPTEAGPAAMLAHARAYAPEVTLGEALASRPMVRALIALADPALRAAAHAELRRVVGAPDATGRFVEIERADAVYASILVTLLERALDAAPDDALAGELAAIRTRHRDPALADYARAATLGPIGKRALCACFASSSPATWALEEQQRRAAEALLELDPDDARARTTAILDRDSGSAVDGAALIGVLEALRAGKTTHRSPAWVALLDRVQERRALGLGPHVCEIAIAWRLPDAAARVVAGLRAGDAVDLACKQLERIGDASVIDALREIAAGTKARADRQRIERTITKLGGATATATPDDAAAAARDPDAPRATGDRLELSPSGRATCKVCNEKIALGELRFGLVAPGPAGSTHETMRWYHLRCAAQKKAKALAPILAAYAGEVPGRAELEAMLAPKGKKKGA